MTRSFVRVAIANIM